jgi:radical SAM protein with 4Fe4S-binding SPASM domain
MSTSSVLQKIKQNAGMARAYLHPRQVGYLIFYVTNRCNFRCNFCFYSAEIEKGLKPDEMTVDEIRRMAKKLGPLLQLSLTGGEPFIRNEFAAITRILLDHTGARYVTIPTNASMTERTVRFLEELLPAYPRTYFRIAISIEGIESEHDEIRSMPGSFGKIRATYQAIEPFRRQYGNLVIDSNSVYTARSENTLLATLKHLDREFQFDNISVTFARGEVADPELKKVSQHNYLRINEFLESVKRRREARLLYPLWRGVRDVSRQHLIRTVFYDEFVTPCVAGRKLAIVSETGDVYPCEILNRKMGNLRDFEYDLHAVLRTQESRQLVKWIKDSKCKCSFECALAANVVWNASTYPKLAVAALKNIGRH